MSTHTLSSFNSVGITLTANGYDLSPFTITSTGTVQNTVTYGSAVYSTISNPTLVNNGLIDSYGIHFTNGGTVINNASISGSGAKYQLNASLGAIRGLVFVSGGPGMVVNTGTIHSSVAGVALKAGGFVSNSSAGYIYGLEGIDDLAGAVTVVNAGQILGLDEGGNSGESIGIILAGSGSTLSNEAGALVRGNLGGVEMLGSGSVYNAGTIEDLGSFGEFNIGAIDAGNGVTISNSGTIVAYNGVNAINLYAGATVTNSGIISSSTNAIDFGGTGSNRLIVDAGAVFIGSVTAASSASNFLEFAAETNASTGTLTGIGTQFTGFQTIAFDTGAKWQIEGSLSGLANGETISGFTIGDTIILDGFAATSDTYTSHGLVLGNGTSFVTLDITGSFTTANFDVVDPPAETTITVVCYLRGTRIATPAGERAVEDLAIGDAVITKFGGYRRIKWMGRQSYARRFIAGNFEQIPVKFAAGSLGPNLPKRDLFVSPGHAMLVGRVLVLAKSLVNGITITQSDCPERVDYFQLEFETHDCVLAEGVWSESYADTPGLRAKFHNAAEFYALYPGHIEPETQCLCAPRPLEGPGLDAVLRPLLARLPVRPGRLHGCVDEVSPGMIRGWAWDEANPHLPVLLEIAAGNRVMGTVLACDYRGDLAKAGIGRGHCSFAFTVMASLPMNRPLLIRRVQDHAKIQEPVRRNLKGLRQATG